MTTILRGADVRPPAGAPTTAGPAVTLAPAGPVTRRAAAALLDWLPGEWANNALCAQVDVGELFFPEKGESTRAAKAVCANCPVRAECLQYALDNNERFGVWGGLSERERRAVRRRTATVPSQRTEAI